MSGAILRYANHSNAGLTGAIISDVDFTGAMLIGLMGYAKIYLILLM